MEACRNESIEEMKTNFNPEVIVKENKNHRPCTHKGKDQAQSKCFDEKDIDLQTDDQLL